MKCGDCQHGIPRDETYTSVHGGCVKVVFCELIQSLRHICASCNEWKPKLWNPKIKGVDYACVL